MKPSIASVTALRRSSVNLILSLTVTGDHRYELRPSVKDGLRKSPRKAGVSAASDQTKIGHKTPAAKVKFACVGRFVCERFFLVCLTDFVIFSSLPLLPVLHADYTLYYT